METIELEDRDVIVASNITDGPGDSGTGDF